MRAHAGRGSFDILLPVPSRRAALNRQTISVLCPTAHPGPLVAGLLWTVREVVDEIIVAADMRVAGEDLGHYAEVADVLLRYEHSGPNRHWPWLADQARGDWLFLLDGDELPSTALIRSLPEMVVDRHIRQWSLPIHWPWPDASLRLAGEPWASDRRLRLLRNDGRLLFGARKHALAEPDGPIRYLDQLPVYHLDLLLPDRARREAKVGRYESHQFGMLTPEGQPVNAGFYLPEKHDDGGLVTLPVPAEDCERIARALAARPDRMRSLDPGGVALVDSSTVTWHAPRPCLPDDAYRATLELAQPLPPFSAGRRDHQVWINVTNDGTARWPGRDHVDPLVRVGIIWRTTRGGEPASDAGRAVLPHALDPGERALVPVQVSGPSVAGPMDLELDLVHELVRWFGDSLVAHVVVGPSAVERLAALARDSADLVSLDEAWIVRREVGGRDVLLREAGAAAPPADRRIARLIKGMTLGGWALDAATIDRLVALVRRRRPTTVVEFGSGTSTVVLAALLDELHEPGAARVISFDQDPAWAGRTREALARRGLQDHAHVMHLPLDDPAGGGPRGYALTPEAEAQLMRHAPELVLVDGPALDSGASRLGTVDLVKPYLRRHATLLLDDALRDAELCIAQAWSRRGDVAVRGIWPTPKGLLEATLSASSSPLTAAEDDLPAPARRRRKLLRRVARIKPRFTARVPGEG